ncbi:hypothetical protein FACS1894147_06790 [Spirochaetia bacterium]|nr:hypothetical protein FACS1894147_06790 [Spirochaetia bacterium]
MKKSLLLVTLLAVISFWVYAQDTADTEPKYNIAVQYYLQSFWGFINSGAMAHSEFEDKEIGGRITLPFEVKTAIFQFGESPFVLFGLGGVSFMWEDHQFSSINVSAGIGLNRRDEKSTGLLDGQYVTLSLYDYPLFTFGKTALYPWRFALDIGTSISSAPLYMSFYMREMFWLLDVGFPIPGIPDFGIAVGLVF